MMSNPSTAEMVWNIAKDIIAPNIGFPTSDLLYAHQPILEAPRRHVADPLHVCHCNNKFVNDWMEEEPGS